MIVKINTAIGSGKPLYEFKLPKEFVNPTTITINDLKNGSKEFIATCGEKQYKRIMWIGDGKKKRKI